MLINIHYCLLFFKMLSVIDIPFDAIKDFFNINDILILINVSKYFQKNIKKKIKLNNIPIADQEYGFKLMKIFDNITFKILNHDAYHKLFDSKIVSFNMSHIMIPLSRLPNLIDFSYIGSISAFQYYMLDKLKSFNLHFKRNTTCDYTKKNKIIRKNDNLEKLSIFGLKINDRDLNHYPNLTDLELGSNNLIGTGFIYIPKLKKLTLPFKNENLVADNFSYLSNLLELKINFPALGEILKYLPNLTKLVITSKNNVYDKDLQQLHHIKELHVNNKSLTSKALIHLKNLEILYLDESPLITDECLHFFPKLKILKLGQSHITDLGLYWLSLANPNGLICFGTSHDSFITNEGLKHHKKIQTLSLIYNDNIDNKGLSYLSGTLTDLTLSGNEKITDEILELFPNLINLNLYLNYMITDKGLKYLTKLEYLHIGPNFRKISYDGLSHLNTLRKLFITYDNDDDDTLQFSSYQIEKLKKSNQNLLISCKSL